MSKKDKIMVLRMFLVFAVSAYIVYTKGSWSISDNTLAYVLVAVAITGIYLLGNVYWIDTMPDDIKTEASDDIIYDNWGNRSINMENRNEK